MIPPNASTASRGFLALCFVLFFLPCTTRAAAVGPSLISQTWSEDLFSDESLRLSLTPEPFPEDPEFLGDPFSNTSLQPVVPAAAIESRYNLVQELQSWSDLSVLVNLAVSIPSVLDALLSESREPWLVFAPTNEAFATIARLLNPALPEELTPAATIAALVDIFEGFSGSPDAPTVEGVLQYHVVQESLSESEIQAGFRLPTLFGKTVATRDYPNRIFDRNDGPPRAAKRLGRQISNTDGRISIISEVLLPFNIPANVSRFAVTSRQQAQTDDSLFKPLKSIADFVVGRNDLRVLLRLADKLGLVDVLASPDILHVFAPTNAAFISLVQELVPEDVAEDVVPGNNPTLEEFDGFADAINTLWDSLDGVPSLTNVILYHVLATDSDFESLVGLGPQNTVFGDNITITSSGVQDADPTADAGVIASFATQNGFVTVIDGVLIPFTLEDGRQAVVNALGIGPMPIVPETVEPSVEPEFSEEFSVITPEPIPELDTTPEITPSETEEEESTSNNTSPTPEEDDPVCFPGNARVTLSNGQSIRMYELEAGHEVNVGDGTSSQVFLFTHKQSGVINDFTKITTKFGHEVALTPSHYLYANGRLTAAKAVVVGDILDTINGRDVVVKTKNLRMNGLYAPHTVHGDILVDGVRVSGYSTAIHPRLAHALLAPVRLFVKWTGIREPLGSTFYGGASRIAKLIPSGRLIH